MIKVGDNYLRNLEEQVQYLTSYHEVNQGLAQWGIRVVGKVATEADLPDPITYTGEYGDAYAVGEKSPYDFYIFSRPSNQNPNKSWFPFGPISIVGPQGPKGDKGDKGDTGESTKWYSYIDLPSNPVEGDMALKNDGNVYRYQNGDWVAILSIKGPQGAQGPIGAQGPVGPQGPQGEKGDTGDVGGFINIYGVLPNSTSLPTPASLNNLTVAYLVGAASPYDLYVQIGKNSDEAVWTNTGPFNAATAVSVKGVFQNIWDADTKLDKVTKSTSTGQVYAKRYNGAQQMLNIATGNAITGSTEIAATSYVDDYFARKPTTSSDYTRLIAYRPNGDVADVNLYSSSNSFNYDTVPVYSDTLSVGMSATDISLPMGIPKYPYAAANKAYVDGIFSLSGTTLTITTEQ